LQPPILLPLIEEQERFNSLECKGSYSATSNNKDGTLAAGGRAVSIWYSDEGTRQGRRPPRPLLAVLNITPPINGQCTNHRFAVYNCS